MVLSTFQDWFAEWLPCGERYDDPPPVTAALLVGALALAGAAVVAADVNGLAHGLLNPLALAPALLTALLFGFWVHRGGWRLALLVAGDLVASAGGMMLLAGTMNLDRGELSRWLTAFVLSSLLVGAFLHARAWAILSWYARVHASSLRQAEALRAVLAGPATGSDFVVEARWVQEGIADIELRDAAGARRAWADPDLLSTILKKLSLTGPTFFLVHGAAIVEEPDTSDGYRDRRGPLRLVAVAESVFLGRRPRSDHVSFAPEIAVSVAMLLIQHGLLALGAAVLARWL